MAETTKVPHADPIDLSEWGFEKSQGECIASAIEETFSRFPPDVWLPFSWAFGDGDGIGGPRVIDPGTIYVSLPFAFDESSYAWTTSLSAVVEDFMDGHQDRNEKTSEQAKALFKALAQELRRLADKLDSSAS